MTNKFPGEYYQFTEDDILPDGTISDKVPIFVKVLYLKGELEIEFYSNASPAFITRQDNGKRYSCYRYRDEGDYIVRFGEPYSSGVNDFSIVSNRIFTKTFGNLIK
ncbi:hypothetical protein RND61_15435 [Streptomyces sp. TRM76323]|uniref:Uncharacterized protein n=1 Tax=Streptomyces tamarix TaxID=3078565 RepID=A0ABU3QKY8_9ACTN|nr:hypothetical protein [Streptomyces tamarix]MDT9683440.1 hypothetical protein [Streptomyces tamarix]